MPCREHPPPLSSKGSCLAGNTPLPSPARDHALLCPRLLVNSFTANKTSPLHRTAKARKAGAWFQTWSHWCNQRTWRESCAPGYNASVSHFSFPKNGSQTYDSLRNIQTGKVIARTCHYWTGHSVSSRRSKVTTSLPPTSLHVAAINCHHLARWWCTRGNIIVIGHLGFTSMRF